jgi:lipopolysaccharide transport system permease protein
VAVALPALMFLSPVFYPVDAVPESFRPFMRANPLTDVIESVRALVIHGALPELLPWLLSLAGATAIAAAGWLWFRRLAPGFADLL